jgi:lipid-binding SYLF domain-containing protein
VFEMALKRVLCLLVALGMSGAALAQGNREKEIDRLKESGEVLKEIMDAPDKGIPLDIISSADCVAVVPSMLKGGFIIGAAYGNGVATCRSSAGWSAPAFFRIAGGSFGFQIGGQAVDYVMLIMNERGMRALLSSKFKLGADASVAAGPVGRNVEGMTDWKMRAQVLTYSRARGVFAGISLNGAVISQAKDSTRAFYGKMVPFRVSLLGEVPAPADAHPFLAAVAKYGGSGATAKPSPPATSPAPAKPAAAPSPENKAQSKN